MRCNCVREIGQASVHSRGLPDASGSNINTYFDERSLPERSTKISAGQVGSSSGHSEFLSIVGADLEAADWVENHVPLSIDFLNPFTLCNQLNSGPPVAV